MKRAYSQIHPTAIVHPDARIAADVTIEPYAIVEGDVTLAEGVRIAAHAVVRAGSDLAEHVQIDSFAVVGGLPQMRKAPESFGHVRIGRGSVLREGVTVHRATCATRCTIVGEDCMLMSHSHCAHDVVLGKAVTLANNVMLAGHVVVGDNVFVGGGAGIHQFVRIGCGAMIGGNASISYDVPPYAMAAERNDICGLNLVGMRRQGMAVKTIADLKRCFHSVFSGGGDPRECAEAALAESNGIAPEGRAFLEFFATGRRGFARKRS